MRANGRGFLLGLILGIGGTLAVTAVIGAPAGSDAMRLPMSRETPAAAERSGSPGDTPDTPDDPGHSSQSRATPPTRARTRASEVTTGTDVSPADEWNNSEPGALHVGPLREYPPLDVIFRDRD